MRPREALRNFTGRSYNYGDGPLGAIGQQLLANFQAREADRLAAADERAAMAGRGPILDVLRRKLAELRAADLFNDATPCVSTFDAHMALKNARAQYPTDQGLKRAAIHAERLWHKEPLGTLTIGDVARLREVYARQYPRSVVGEVIDAEIPRVGYNTLPVAKLAQMAAQITGDTEDQRQYAYEQVIRANGLATSKPEHVRARGFIRALADMAVEPPPQQGAMPGGAHAAQRALWRMASYDDPILSMVGQMDGGMPPPDMMPPAEEAIPHEETTEVIEEITSPNSGEPMTIELGVAEPMPEGGPATEAPTDGPEEISPEFVASLNYFGQLDDFAQDDMGMMSGPGAEGMDPFDPGGETTTVLEDPTAPGQMIEVTVAPVEEQGPDMGVSPSSGPMPAGLDSMASARGRAFGVYSVRGGIRHPTPLERIRAPGMPAMLRRIALQLREADGGYQVPRAVLAHNIADQALIVLDPDFGNYLLVRAESFSPNIPMPSIPSDGQPVVQHNLQIDKGDGSKVLLEDGEIKQNVPKALGEEGEGEHKAKALTAEQVQKICARIGITAELVESKILDGAEVRVGSVGVRMDDAGDVVLFRGDRGRTASLMDLDEVVRDFMALAAREAAMKATAKPIQKLSFEVRPIFSVGCGTCGQYSEYLMPDQPQNVHCASCGWVTPLEAVAIQLEARQAAAEAGQTLMYPGYVITADVPGDPQQHSMNAKRMLSAIKQVVHTSGAVVRQGQLSVTVKNAGDAELARIRRVLTDMFGAREVAAQQAPVDPQGAPTQHATVPMQPSPAMPPAQPTYQPPQPALTGTPAQQQMIQQHTNPGTMPQVKPMAANRLPVGAGIKHVEVQYPDGKRSWIPVEAATDQIARSMIASFMDGTQVVQVVDSLARAAQMPPAPAPQAAPPPAPPPGGAPGGGGGGMPLGMEMTGPGGAQGAESSAVDPETKEVIRAGLMHFRNTGVPIDEAIKNLGSSYPDLLKRYGDESSPARHMLGGIITQLAEEIYEKPAIINPQQMMATRRRAKDKPEGPQPKKINTQQDDWVKLPGGGEVLGDDSSTGGGYKEPGKIKPQHKMQDNAGTSKGDGKPGADSSTRDPGDFGAGKGYDGSGHVTFDGPGWGQSWSDTELGEDRAHGHGESSTMSSTPEITYRSK